MLNLTTKLAIFLIILSLSHSAVQIQSAEYIPLPESIIFSASQGEEERVWHGPWGGFKYNLLAYVDRDNLDINIFYRDETAAFLKPLSWSPQGRFLAVLRIEPTDELEAITQICILTKSGELQVCFEDRPTGLRHLIHEHIEDAYTTTWSADGQRIYFVVEDISGNQAKQRLIEADIVTGNIVREIYQTEYFARHQIPILSWTSDLDYVAVGVAGSGESVHLIELGTGKEVSLESLEGKNISSVCGQFSPLGSYLVAIEQYDADQLFAAKHLILLNKRGQIVHEIDVTDYDLNVYDLGDVVCPVWRADENEFYLHESSEDSSPSQILLYKFQQNTLEEYLQIEDFYVLPPMTLSPESSYIVFSSFPVTGLGAGTTEGYQVTVVYPDKKVTHLGAPFAQAQWPIWVPTGESE